jgi:hypothetical protein
LFENETLLKEKLEEIKRNDYAVPDDICAYELAQCMMNKIGSIDPQLRDMLINRVICRWIDRKILTDEQIIELLNMSMSEDHLFYKIGLIEDDSVFKRSFCVLNVAQIIYTHRKNNFLSFSEIGDTKKKVIKYMLNERDLRGYVEDKGWAHSAAHGADALDELAQCNENKHDDLLDILEVVRTKACINSYTYINQEDERLTTAVENTIKRNLLEESEIVNWIEGFKTFSKIGKYPEDDRLTVNKKSFLRSLYFRLLDQNISQAIMDSIRQVL